MKKSYAVSRNRIACALYMILLLACISPHACSSGSPAVLCAASGSAADEMAQMLATGNAAAAEDARAISDWQQEKQRCKAITQKGTQCKRDSKEGKEYCWQHEKIAADKRCKAITKKGTQCSRKAKSANGYCTQHAKMLE